MMIEKKESIYIAVGIITFVLVALIGGFVGLSFLPVFVITMVAVLVVELICVGIINKVEAPARERNSLMLFYQETQSAGIVELRSEGDIQRASLIAQKYGLKYTNIYNLYYSARNLYEQTTQAQQNAERIKALNQLGLNERIEYHQLSKYANYTGRVKRIAMLQEVIQIHEMEAKKAADLQRALSVQQRNSLEREKNSAIHGGIADAIAGPAAGVATAARIEAENAEIRARNAVRLQNMQNRNEPLRRSFSSREDSHIRSAQEYKEELEAARTKLVASVSAAECLQHLVISSIIVNVSATGTCIVQASVIQQAPQMIIFDNVAAVIDGTLIAEIYDVNRFVGYAELVLPLEGVNAQTASELKGMCLFCGARIGNNYTVQIKPKYLWAMET